VDGVNDHLITVRDGARGFGHLIFEKEKDGYSINTIESAAGTGLGAALVYWLAMKSKKDGFPGISVTPPISEAGQDLFEKLGFKMLLDAVHGAAIEEAAAAGGNEKLLKGGVKRYGRVATVMEKCEERLKGKGYFFIVTNT